MTYNDTTIEDVIEKFKDKDSWVPIIANCENLSDYEALYNKTSARYNVIHATDCLDDDGLPSAYKLYLTAKNVEEKTVVFGLFHVCAFLGGAEELQSYFNKVSKLGVVNNNKKKLLFVAFGLRDKLKDYLINNPNSKYRAHFYFINSNERSQIPELIISSYKTGATNEKAFDNLIDYFKYLEKHGTCVGYVLDKWKHQKFKVDIYNVIKQQPIIEYLKEKDSIFKADVFANFEQEFYCNLNSKMGDKRFLDYVNSIFTKGFDTAISNYENYDQFNKTLIYIWLILLKRKKDDDYLSIVADNINCIDDVLPQIFNTIIEIPKNDTNFDQYYKERKKILDNLTFKLNESNYLDNYLDKLNGKEFGIDEVNYLTDLTPKERVEILTCLSQSNRSLNEINQITKNIYPKLYYYMQEYDFQVDDDNVLNSYINEYKMQKFKNKVESVFIEKVNSFAKSKQYTKYEYRNELCRKIDLNGKIYTLFVDCLGIEYCGFIEAYCKEKGLRVNIRVGQSNLPSITSKNSDFYEIKYDKDEKVKKLDNLKHEVPINNMPVYIVDEIEYLSEIIDRAKKELEKNKYHKYIIMSDHGSSRLARIWQGKTIKVPKQANERGRHGGRCCLYNEEISNHSNVIVSADKKYCVMANYDRFSSSQKFGYEMHGGATLEEIMVPIIEIQIAKITAKICSKDELNIDKNCADPIIVQFNHKDVEAYIKIIEKIPSSCITTILDKYDLKLNKNTKNYECRLPCKAGEIKFDLYANGEKVLKKIKVKFNQKDKFDDPMGGMI
ncbi:MAG: BREX-4 system phosphatase PglZ [Christensenellaceae bacterium]|jgi:hypothetical protein|nr:BREX-4 system phosphatase PglZ [Christensenellaceae bacterium]